jgi:4-hydroxy-3-methylbut-2-enyl diphosphate reductase IspH
MKSMEQGGVIVAVEKTIASTSLAEVVDRILDKGIVIDAWARVSLVGIELLAIEARVVVASVETYLKYAEAIGLTATAAAPAPVVAAPVPSVEEEEEEEEEEE